MSEYTETGAMPVREPKPRAWKGLLFLLVLVAIVAVLGLFVLQQRSVDGPLVVKAAPKPLSVNTLQVSLQDHFVADERFSGLVTPRRTSQLGFATGGRVQSLKADVGDKVVRGRVLARLDTRALRAQLAAAEAVVVEAETAHALALATVQRQVTLSGQGHVSQQRVDEATAQANSARARIDAAQANADTLSVQIDLARIDAPYAGVITARMADEGAIAGPGQPVFELVETGRLEARIGLTAKLASTLKTGETYRLVSDRGEVAATLRSVTGVIDATQRTVTTMFDIDEPENVSVGAVVRIELDRTVDERGLWLPVSALSEREHGLWSVFVARREDGSWTAQPGTVEVIHTDGDRAYVRGAIRDGDLLILDGLQRIAPGQPVIPTRINQTASAQDNG